MSTQEPQERGLRHLPGFTVAAVAFVMIVILGVGGMAVANWSQSAKVTVGITAGAAPAPTPLPTPSTPNPTQGPGVPASGAGNIVVNPVFASRPARNDNDGITCTSPGNSGKITVNWTGNHPAGTTYVVSLKSNNAAKPSEQRQTVPQKTALFTLGNSPEAHGEYMVRVQPMLATGAGDPIYETLRYAGKDNWGCYYASAEGQSPLGSFTVAAAPTAAVPKDNVLNLSWPSVSPSASYVVTIKSTTSSYGAELTTTALGAALTFPPRVRDQWGNPTNNGPYFSDYTLRIQPMSGGVAGDPVYKVVRYYANFFSTADY